MYIHLTMTVMSLVVMLRLLCKIRGHFKSQTSLFLDVSNGEKTVSLSLIKLPLPPYYYTITSTNQ